MLAKPEEVGGECAPVQNGVVRDCWGGVEFWHHGRLAVPSTLWAELFLQIVSRGKWKPSSQQPDPMHPWECVNLGLDTVFTKLLQKCKNRRAGFLFLQSQWLEGDRWRNGLMGHLLYYLADKIRTQKALSSQFPRGVWAEDGNIFLVSLGSFLLPSKKSHFFYHSIITANREL
jgi:hypothetical protein